MLFSKLLHLPTDLAILPRSPFRCHSAEGPLTQYMTYIEGISARYPVASVFATPVKWRFAFMSRSHITITISFVCTVGAAKRKSVLLSWTVYIALSWTIESRRSLVSSLLNGASH